MRRALTIAKILALSGSRQFLRNPITKRILYTRYEYLVLVITTAICIVAALVLGYVYGVELFLDPWKPNIFIDVVTSFLCIFTLIACTFSSVKGLIMSPGYELILYQPIDFDEIVIGLVLGSILQIFIEFAFITCIPLIILLLGTMLGRQALVHLLKPGISFVLLLTYIVTCYMLLVFTIDVTKIVLLKKRGENIPLLAQISALMYMIMGVSHSIILSIDNNFPIISPVLTLPIKIFHIIAFEISRFIGFIGYILGWLIMFSLCYVLLRHICQSLSAEDFISIKDVYEIRLTKQLEKELKRRPLASWRSSEDALKQILIDLSPLSPHSNIKIYVTAFSVTVCIAIILRILFTEILNATVEYFWSFIVGISSIMFVYTSLVSELLFNDLKSLWILRIYSYENLPFVKILNIKYLSYIEMALVILSLFISIVLQKFHLMFLPLLNLPFICISNNLLIVLGFKYLRRHKGRPPSYFGITSNPASDIHVLSLFIAVLPLNIGLSLFISLIIRDILAGLNLVLALVISILAFILLNLLLIRYTANWFARAELY